MEHLVRIYKKLLRETDTGFFRYLYKDIAWGNRMFEIGGKSKGKRQIEMADEGYLVKDNIEFSSGNILPLWWFGLNY